MVHGLAAQLGGTLRIRSAPGVGTSVELWLPASEQQMRGREAPEPVSRGSDRGIALLIDDEPLVRASTADMLVDLGFEVVEAGSGDAALAKIEAGLAPSVLITDHLMPGTSGTELARLVRRRWPNLPVLVISGYADVEGIAADLPRLTKPFRQQELAASLAELAIDGPCC